MSAHKLNVARKMEDLPESCHYELPNWQMVGRYRATAWAYLNRDDGGNVVIVNGQKWHSTKAGIVT